MAEKLRISEFTGWTSEATEAYETEKFKALEMTCIQVDVSKLQRAENQ